MDKLLLLLYVSLFLWLFYKNGKTQPAPFGKWFMPLLFLFKLACGILAYQIHYTFYGGGDIATFYSSTEKLKYILFNHYEVFWDVFWLSNIDKPEVYFWVDKIAYWEMDNKWLIPNDIRFITRILFVFNLASLGNYFSMMAILSAISLSALNGYFRFLKWLAPNEEKLALWAAYLIPSVLFWSSAVLKESFAISAIGFTLYFIFRLSEKFKPKYIPGLLIALISLVLVKAYLIISLLPPLVYLLVVSAKKYWNKLVVFCTTILLFGVAFLFNYLITPSFNFFEVLQKRQIEFDQLGKERANSYFEIKLFDTKWDLISYAPKANLNTWFQPQVFEQAISYVYYLQIAETLIIYIFVITGITALLKYRKAPSKKQLNAIFFCFLAVIFLGTLIGSTVPVQGAISRYKAPFMPFFAFGFLMLFKNSLKQMIFTFAQKFKANDKIAKA
jgi:hypothetical protein